MNMELTGQERLDLLAGLTSAFTGYEELLRMANVALNVNLNTLTSHNGTLNDAASQLINWCDANGRLDDLLDGALRQNSGNADLNTIVKRLRETLRMRRSANWYVAADPTQTALLHQRQVIIDRRRLRTAVTDLATDQGYRLLGIHGDPVSGKSYSLQYIMYQCGRLNHIRVASIDLRDISSTQFGPDDLARQIALQMSVPVETIPTQQAQAAKWVQELGAWVVGQAQRSDLPWWIVLDGFDAPELPVETKDLIQEIMARAAGNATKLRIVLLSYKEEMAPLHLRRRVNR